MKLRDLLPKEHGFMVTLSLGRPVSRGEIRLRSADPYAAPVVSPHYFQEQDDLHRLARSVGMMRQMLQARAFARYVSSEVQPGPDVVDESGIRDAVRAKGGTSYHPLGTCRMGADHASVVDPALKVRGVANLRVADASIMPTALTTVIHAPTIMIAEKASEMILHQA